MTAIDPELVRRPTDEPVATGSGRRVRGLVAAWRVLIRRPTRLIGAVILVIFALMAIAGPWFYPEHLPIDPENILSPPSLAHPLGTDFAGTDVVALLITGTRYVMVSALWASLFTIVIGTGLGLFAGYRLGWPDSVLMKITDFILTIPSFPLLVVLATLWDFSSAFSMGLVLGLLGWGGLARAVRSQVLSLRTRGFVEAARSLGPATAQHHLPAVAAQRRPVHRDEHAADLHRLRLRPGRPVLPRRGAVHRQQLGRDAQPGGARTGPCSRRPRWRTCWRR